MTALYDLYFDKTPVGQGDVYAFISNDQNALFFDLYRELTDQLDIISIAISVSHEQIAEVKSLLRHAFDHASCQIQYEEGSFLHAFRYMIDIEIYPKVIEESGYRQQLIMTSY